MLRTQIYLPEDFHSQLGELAVKLNVSMAEVIRMILKNGLKKKEEFLSPGNDLWKLANLKIKGGPRDLAKNLDRYLYGKS
ncbi:MAG: CopG family transcriptional regulator [Microgenomates group bacterium]